MYLKYEIISLKFLNFSVVYYIGNMYIVFVFCFWIFFLWDFDFIRNISVF